MREFKPDVHNTALSNEVHQLIDDVATGRIQRGGKQAKYVVYKDGSDIVIKLFGGAKK